MSGNQSGNQGQHSKDQQQKARPQSGQDVSREDDDDSKQGSSTHKGGNAGNFANDPDRARKSGEKGGKA
jgi:general stress protein YciG